MPACAGIPRQKKKMSKCICPQFKECCALCGMLSCDCGPNDYCHIRMRCKAHEPKGRIDYGASFRIERSLIEDQLFEFFRE